MSFEKLGEYIRELKDKIAELEKAIAEKIAEIVTKEAAVRDLQARVMEQNTEIAQMIQTSMAKNAELKNTKDQHASDAQILSEQIEGLKAELKFKDELIEEKNQIITTLNEGRDPQ
jgi:chromosome segregation ATPase